MVWAGCLLGIDCDLESGLVIRWKRLGDGFQDLSLFCYSGFA
jgi:hypothetical protein